ncbi:MAG: hypothetical protein HBSAPP03_05190 [Phycisphaerae bacterium]|nr:MAG: hypothetical protein HBSAPP03_05190 [Phycisphaerae bacterium]
MILPRLLAAAGLLLLVACSANPLGLRPGATSVLQTFADPTPSEAVDMALDKHDADRRYRGTLILAKQRFAGDPLYLDLFARGITDADPGVRAASARALGLHGRADHAPLLIARLTDEDPSVREEAARALQRLHTPEAVEPLMNAMRRDREDETPVRVQAALALGQYAQARVVEQLIAAMADESLAVNASALSSLRTLTGQDFGYDRAEWQRWYNATDTLFAARVAYLYPAFSRRKRWYEYIPLIPPPPNEPTGLPVGVNPDFTAGK